MSGVLVVSCVQTFDEHEDRVREALLDLPGPEDVDLEQRVGVGRRLRHRRALQVVEELDPLEEALGLDVGLELVARGEDVGVLGLPGTALSGAPT